MRACVRACVHSVGRGKVTEPTCSALRRHDDHTPYTVLVECACGPLGAVEGSGGKREDRREAEKRKEEEEEEGEQKGPGSSVEET